MNPQHRAPGLRLLREEGLLESRRGRGVSVVGVPERGAVVEGARGLVEIARRYGDSPQELIDLITDMV